jgi:hypothetical protein
MLSCLRLYAERYAPLLSEMRSDVEEFLATGNIRRARELTAATGQRFDADRLPQFFTGDLDGPVVLVHLNPKQAKVRRPPPAWQDTVQTLEDYLEWYRHFGERMYGRCSPRTHQSPFDLKQIRFLQPLRVIDFVEERSCDDRFTNLERVIDYKLQLELVPYGSVSFSTHGFTPEVLAPHLNRILSTIAVVPRRYVLFCGAVFRPLLKKYVTRRHQFHLRKNDGTLERQSSSFANLLLPYQGGSIRAGLAQTWPRQGIPMAAYAEEVQSRYEDDGAY